MEQQPICECDIIHEDVVQAVRGQFLEKETYISLATLFKLFGDSTRLQILHALEQHVSVSVILQRCLA